MFSSIILVDVRVTIHHQRYHPYVLPLGRLEGYMNSETHRPSWKMKVSITTRLQYDILNGDKHTRAWIHKTPRFLGEFQEIKCLEITEISIVDASETK